MPSCIAPITVDSQLAFRELKGADELFELGGEARVVLLHQCDEGALLCTKSLGRNGTLGSIHGRASIE